MSDTPKVIIPGNLKGSVPENIVTDALYILDSSRAKNQKVINDEFEQRIDDIQELAEISIEGGTIQIANATDFDNPTQEQRAKVPTVGAVIDGYTANILPNTGSPSTPIYIDNFHRPQVVTSILLPGNISSQNGNVEALNGGVAAFGIGNLGLGGGGGGGDVSSILFNPAVPYVEGEGYIAVEGILSLPAYPSISGKADKVVNATEGNFASLDVLGNLQDAGVNALSFATAAQGAKADVVEAALAQIMTPKGNHSLPVYINTSGIPTVIDSLNVTGNIQSTQGGVSAFGMGSLALGGGGGQGTLTEIQIDGTTIPDVEGIVNLPAYPTWATLSGRPTLSAVATSGRFVDLTDTPSTLAGYGILDAKIDNGVITLGSNSITPITSHQTIYTLTIQKNGTTVDSFNAASANKTINIQDVASLSAFNTLVGHLTSKGSHSRPIYLNGTPEGVEIDSLNVPGNIESTQGGVSAFGISNLAVSGGSGTGTLTQIQINGTPVTDTDGIVNITATTGSSAGKIAIAGQQIAVNGLGSAAYASTSDFASASHTQPFSTLTNLPTTLSGYGITDAASSSDLSSLSGRVNTVEGYFNGGIANSAARLSNNIKIGDTNNPVYFTANGVPAAISYTINRNIAANEDVTAYQSGDSINITNHVVKVQMAGTSSPSASGNDISFIDTISQSTAGVLTATKKTVRSATQSQSGVVTTGEQTFAGAKTFNSTLTAIDDITSTTGDIMALAGGVSAFGIASLSSSGGGGSGTLTQIQVNGIALGDTEGIVNITATSGSANGQIKIAGQNINVTGLGQAAYCGLGQVYSGNSGLVTGGQVYSAISALPTPMQFKGSLGVGGTYTAATLPAAAASNNGWDLKVITDGTYQGVVAKVGDQLISDGTNWILIPSGDEPSGTVTSVGMTVPTGLSVSGSPITSSGILAISFASGYSIPTTSKQSNWDTAYTHASDSSRLTTAKASAFYKFGTTAQGHISSVTAVSWSDITGLDNGTTYAPYNSAGYLPLSGGTMANTNVVTNLNADLLDGKHASSFVLYDAGATEQTIKSSISSLSKGVINLWRNSGDDYTFLGFSNGTTETYLGGIGFKSQSDHNLYRKNGSNYYKIWDENNDGSGSGLDADKLDGVELTGLFTTLENSNNQVSITIGTTNKKLTVAYASVAGKVGTSTVGSTSRPVYINSGVPAIITSLSVPGNIESTAGGVSANGIVSLALNGGGGGGTLTQIQINGVPLSEESGIVNIAADQTYNASTNKIATQATVTNAINTLDYTAIGLGTGKTLASLTEVNGVISATFQDISITASQISNGLTTFAPYNVNGYLPLNGGTLTGNLIIGSTSANHSLTVHGPTTFETTDFGSQLEIWRRSANGYSAIKFCGGTTKTELGYIGITSSNDTTVGSGKPFWNNGSASYKLIWANANSTTAVGGTTTPVYIDTNGQVQAGTTLGTASTHAHGDYVTGISWDSTTNKLAWSKGGTAQTTITINYSAYAGTSNGFAPEVLSDFNNGTKWRFFRSSGSEDSHKPSTRVSWFNGFTLASNNSDSYKQQLAIGLDDPHIYFRNMNSGTWGDWIKLIDSSDIGSQSVNYAATAGSAPASDVYAWAKASTKPSYTASEVGALKNYGNDASRPNGTSFTMPQGANPVSMRSGATSGADIGIFWLSDDNAFVCNSSDNSYLFAAFNTDKTANFSTADNAAFAVLSDHAGVSMKGKLTVAAGGNFGGTLGFGDKYLTKPVADFRTRSATHTGCITITLPASIGNTMTSMWIDVYNYVTNTSFSVHCGGYTYTNSTWANSPFAICYGATHRVRMGHNGTNFVIYIGETDSTWKYPQITVRDVVVGFSQNYSNWEKDWTISFSTSVSNVTADITRYAITSGNIGSQSVSYATSAGSVAWANVTGKPNRAASDSDGGPANVVKGAYTGNGGQQGPSYFGKNKVGFLMMNTTVNSNSHYKDWLIMDCYSGGDVGGAVAIGVNRQALGAYIMRSAAARSTWDESAELIGTHNYTTYTVKKDGTGASGSWGINITGTASNVTGTVAIAHGGTGSSTAAGARANLGTWALVSDLYNTLMPADGTTNGWIKIGTANTSYGLLPSASGGAGSGHNYLGTSSWYWKYAYVDQIYGYLNGNISGSAVTMSSFAQGSGGSDRYVWFSWDGNLAKPAYSSALMINLTSNTLKAPNIVSSGNITATGGVAAGGIVSMSMNGGSAANAVTQINIGSTPYTPTDGIISLPTYPTWSTLSGKPTNVSAFTNDSGYIDSSALAVTFTATTLTSSSTSVYLNNTVQRDTFQKITISSASYGGQTFSIRLTGSGSYYGYHRQVLVMNNSGRNINLSLTNANYIYMGTYEWLTSGGWQHTTDNPIPFDYDMNYMFLLDIIQASSSEYPVVKVTQMNFWAD